VLHDGHLYREQEYVFTRTIAFEVGREIARRSKGLTRVKYLVYDTNMSTPQADTAEETIERCDGDAEEKLSPPRGQPTRSAKTAGNDSAIGSAWPPTVSRGSRVRRCARISTARFRRW
jgi:hypothetical protein